MTLEERAIKITEILSKPHSEIVVNFQLQDFYIDSMELFEDYLFCNVWDGEYEVQYLFSDMKYELKKEIVKKLEELL